MTTATIDRDNDQHTDTADGAQQPDLAALEIPEGMRLVLIPLAELAKHPGNKRRDLRVTKAYVENLKKFGLKVPLIVVPDAGAYRVTDGHRRLAGAEQAGLEKAPCLIDERLIGNEALQYLDMVNTAVHREPLTALEQANALFDAHQHGASKNDLIVTIGSRKLANEALKAASMGEQLQQEAAKYDLTIPQLAALAEFEDDEKAYRRLLNAASRADFDHALELERIDRREEAERKACETELVAAGVQVLGEVPSGARRIGTLTDENGESLTQETHAPCPGHFAIVAAGSDPTVHYYCSDPEKYEHYVLKAAQSASEQEQAARAIATAGNREWRAAEALRHKFLTELIARTSLPAADAEIINRLVASIWLAFGEPLHNGQQAKVREMQSVLLGLERADNDTMGKLAYKVDRRRLPLIALAAAAAPHEVYACSIKVWRTDVDPYDMRWRPYAAQWLNALAGLGHKLTDIEQAVADAVPYTPATRAAKNTEADLEGEAEPAPGTDTEDPDLRPGGEPEPGPDGAEADSSPAAAA